MKQGFVSVFVLLALLALQQPARAQECASNPDALGTSRTVALDTSKGLEVGLQFGHELPLADKEVVLTFDDGPLPVNSEKVRRALKAECVKATFFLVGRNALTYPDFVRKLAADGHSIGTHTWSHDMHMPEKTLAEGLSQINRGFAAVNVALKTSPDVPQAAPFFRFPGLNSDHALRDVLKDRGVGVFDIDIEGGDWIVGRRPEDVFRRVTKQLHERGRGIILLHDIQPRTAAMLPGFLRYLKQEGYKVVHIEPKPKDDMTIAQGDLSQAMTLAAEPKALTADDMITSRAVIRPMPKRQVASAKLQRMATVEQEQVEPEPQIYAPRRARMPAKQMPSPPFMRPAQAVSTRYADMRPAMPPQRSRPKYLLNELFGIGAN